MTNPHPTGSDASVTEEMVEAALAQVRSRGFIVEPLFTAAYPSWFAVDYTGCTYSFGSKEDAIKAAHQFAETANGSPPTMTRAALLMADRIEALEARNRELEAGLCSIKNIVSYPVSTEIQQRGWSSRSIDESGCEYITEKIDALLPSPTGDRK